MSLLTAAVQPGRAQASATPFADEDFHIYRDSPRILLTQQRLRLLQRERERQSLRWEPFEALMMGAAEMPEPGFAAALFYRVAGDEPSGRRAIDWALGEAFPAHTQDLRQMALVFDWCEPLLSPAEKDRLAQRIQPAMAASAADLPGQAARVLAAVALADRLDDAGNAVLRSVVVDWWGAGIAPRLRSGQFAFPQEHLYALMELLHVIRDNTQVDLREAAPAYFENLPLQYIASHYPAPLPAPENEYRIPVYLRDGPPEIEDAIFSRAAGLALVAFDTNALNHQYVQGWLMLDRFLMRNPLGIVYEFLWANPYQPGLSYQTLPEVFHDPLTGHVFARTTWADDAVWLGFFDGRLQMFRDGGIQTLREGAQVAPVQVGGAVIASSASPEGARLRMDTRQLFVLGLTPRAGYGVEIDDQELSFLETDAGGTLVIETAEGIDAGVRLRRRLTP